MNFQKSFLENQAADKEAENRNKDAGKECGPEARDRKTAYYCRNQHQNHRINDQQEQAHRHDSKWQRKQNQQWLDDCIGKTQEQGGD